MADEIINGLIQRQVEEAMAKAIAAERERCAKVVEAEAADLDWGHSCTEFIDDVLQQCIAAIRKGE